MGGNFHFVGYEGHVAEKVLSGEDSALDKWFTEGKKKNDSLSHLVHLLEGLVRVLLILVRPVVDILLVTNGTGNLLLGTLVQ